MIHARKDYNRIQDPALKNRKLLGEGASPISPDEPVFLLRAQDRTSAEVVRFWAWLNSQLPDHDTAAVKLAYDHANLMNSWPIKKTADV